MNTFRRAIPAVLTLVLATGCISGTAYADSSHARIVRLSLVQGDVRFARDVKGDPLSDPQVTWETAGLNLPIRQGYVVATDNGRAEVEFENGALALLAENTVLQFYDLSSEDGGFTTRLILRQGSAEFYVSPGRGDYFSVTGGDFSVQAETKTTFRMNNFDDGSDVVVLHGRLTALSNGKNTALSKGQLLSMRAGEADSAAVERASENDEFDQWALGRISNAESAGTAAQQYTNDSGYVSGYGDLYTYGSWFPVAGYGNCWRPYGVGFGWSPFDYGSWYYDPFFGWAFLGGYSWGWLPYHYGGWIFQPGVGWVWSPTGTLGSPGVGRWRPVTGVWMRNSTGGVAIVPAHPLDTHGKTPLNLAQGLFTVTTRGVEEHITPESDPRWKVENKPARDLMENQLAATSAPTRVPRTMAASAPVSRRGGNGETGSTIVFDRTERRFVNSNTATPAEAGANPAQSKESQAPAQRGMRVYPEQSAATNGDSPVPPASDRVIAREGQTRQFVPSPRVAPAPPSVPRSVANERASGEGGSASEGSRGGGGSSRGSSGGAGSSASSATPSGGARGGSPAGSAGSSAGAGGGGGRPH